MERSYEKSQANFIGKTLFIMGLGLLLTFIVAYFTPIQLITPMMLIVAMIAEVALVFYLSSRINKLSVSAARFWFYVYAALNGFTLSIILVSTGMNLAIIVFLFTALMFFCSAMVGFTVKKDLSAFGQLFMMLLIGILIISVFQIFLKLSGLNFLIAILGIITFCGLTAYDMQNIKNIHQSSYSLSGEETSKYAIIAALRLYLDFINLFLFVLRLFRSR